MQPKALGTAALAAVLVGVALVSPPWNAGSVTVLPRPSRSLPVELRQRSEPRLPDKQIQPQTAPRDQPALPPNTSDASEADAEDNPIL